MNSDVYIEMIRPLKEMLFKWIDKKRPDSPEDRKKKWAYAFAKILVWASEYGAGDPLAGLLLRRVPPDAIRHLHNTLTELGVKNLPKPGSFAWLYLMDLIEHADFGDEELNNALRELARMAKSGGRYIPSFIKEQKKER